MSESDQHITILYTANLRGDLEILPRLHTFIKQLTPDTKSTYLVDLGHSCTPDVWHCAVTEGRSMLVALDGMGYVAANAMHLSQDNRDKLTESTTMALVNNRHFKTAGECVFTVENRAIPSDNHLLVLLETQSSTVVDPWGELRLQAVLGGEVGQVRLTLGPQPRVTEQEIHTLPSHILPDPTISGVVDFVISEARYLKKRLDDKSSD